MSSVPKSGRIADRRLGKGANRFNSTHRFSPWPCDMSNPLLHPHCVWTRLYDGGTRDYNHPSGRGASFAWNGVPTMRQILEAACIHKTSMDVTYILSAKILQIEDEFEQIVTTAIR